MIVETGKKGKIVLECEDCGSVREVQRCTAILEKKEHPCRSCSNKRNGIAKKGKYTAWNSGKRYSIRETERTEYIDTHGYVQVWCGRGEGSRGRKDGYKLKHHLVMEDHLGRSLSPKEIVHHIDGNKFNNDIGNLWLCENTSHHREIHNQLERLAFSLVQSGVISFDKNEESYKRKESWLPSDPIYRR